MVEKHRTNSSIWEEKKNKAPVVVEDILQMELLRYEGTR